ncbi:flagellar FlbD family protein [Aquibacillus koreensis]|uniref:Flagellar FlbD family protein n=1 Tax=Aquibacillus koreensis TaxID=279446 RepID=A0A9X3WLB0_9BACI|nr:flagellar FlbD family protein [Aquibacillus koreensis]MCT2534529.1 flagellar FlbD family protein [Aquibacillus koreensis]MDC3421877.1 flagellar FlbD family protein [Aquibacillus koreensis]
MIDLTRLNGDPFILNALYIEQVQSLPDTTITLTNSKKLVVREAASEVVEQINHFYQQIGLQGCQKEIGEKNES